MDDDWTNPEEDPTILEALRSYLSRPSEGSEVPDRQVTTENDLLPTSFCFWLCSVS